MVFEKSEGALYDESVQEDIIEYILFKDGRKKAMPFTAFLPIYPALMEILSSKVDKIIQKKVIIRYGQRIDDSTFDKTYYEKTTERFLRYLSVDEFLTNLREEHSYLGPEPFEFALNGIQMEEVPGYNDGDTHFAFLCTPREGKAHIFTLWANDRHEGEALAGTLMHGADIRLLDPEPYVLEWYDIFDE